MHKIWMYKNNHWVDLTTSKEIETETISFSSDLGKIKSLELSFDDKQNVINDNLMIRVSDGNDVVFVGVINDITGESTLNEPTNIKHCIAYGIEKNILQANIVQVFKNENIKAIIENVWTNYFVGSNNQNFAPPIIDNHFASVVIQRMSHSSSVQSLLEKVSSFSLGYWYWDYGTLNDTKCELHYKLDRQVVEINQSHANKIYDLKVDFDDYTYGNILTFNASNVEGREQNYAMTLGSSLDVTLPFETKTITKVENLTKNFIYTIVENLQDGQRQVKVSGNSFTLGIGSSGDTLRVTYKVLFNESKTFINEQAVNNDKQLMPFGYIQPKEVTNSTITHEEDINKLIENEKIARGKKNKIVHFEYFEVDVPLYPIKVNKLFAYEIDMLIYNADFMGKLVKKDFWDHYKITRVEMSYMRVDNGEYEMLIKITATTNMLTYYEDWLKKDDEIFEEQSGTTGGVENQNITKNYAVNYDLVPIATVPNTFTKSGLLIDNLNHIIASDPHITSSSSEKSEFTLINKQDDMYNSINSDVTSIAGLSFGKGIINDNVNFSGNYGYNLSWKKYNSPDNNVDFINNNFNDNSFVSDLEIKKFSLSNNGDNAVYKTMNGNKLSPNIWPITNLWIDFICGTYYACFLALVGGHITSDMLYDRLFSATGGQFTEFATTINDITSKNNVADFEKHADWFNASVNGNFNNWRNNIGDNNKEKVVYDLAHASDTSGSKIGYWFAIATYIFTHNIKPIKIGNTTYHTKRDLFNHYSNTRASWDTLTEFNAVINLLKSNTIAGTGSDKNFGIFAVPSVPERKLRVEQGSFYVDNVIRLLSWYDGNLYDKTYTQTTSITFNETSKEIICGGLEFREVKPYDDYEGNDYRMKYEPNNPTNDFSHSFFKCEHKTQNWNESGVKFVYSNKTYLFAFTDGYFNMLGYSLAQFNDDLHFHVRDKFRLGDVYIEGTKVKILCLYAKNGIGHISGEEFAFVFEIDMTKNWTEFDGEYSDTFQNFVAQKMNYFKVSDPHKAYLFPCVFNCGVFDNAGNVVVARTKPFLWLTSQKSDYNKERMKRCYIRDLVSQKNDPAVIAKLESANWDDPFNVNYGIQQADYNWDLSYDYFDISDFNNIKARRLIQGYDMPVHDGRFVVENGIADYTVQMLRPKVAVKDKWLVMTLYGGDSFGHNLFIVDRTVDNEYNETSTLNAFKVVSQQFYTSTYNNNSPITFSNMASLQVAPNGRVVLNTARSGVTVFDIKYIDQTSDNIQPKRIEFFNGNQVVQTHALANGGTNENIVINSAFKTTDIALVTEKGDLIDKRPFIYNLVVGDTINITWVARFARIYTQEKITSDSWYTLMNYVWSDSPTFNVAMAIDNVNYSYTNNFTIRGEHGINNEKIGDYLTINVNQPHIGNELDVKFIASQITS